MVLKFAGEVPCVPLKLTAIAALADMPVNLYVLGDEPGGALQLLRDHAQPGQDRLVRRRLELHRDGDGGAANEAGGNAFIAEYAGTARVMDNDVVAEHRHQPPGVAGRDDARRCSCSWCFAQSLLTYGPMLPLLRQYIPEPQVLIDMGISESQFYNNNATYWAQYQSVVRAVRSGGDHRRGPEPRSSTRCRPGRRCSTATPT